MAASTLPPLVLLPTTATGYQLLLNPVTTSPLTPETTTFIDDLSTELSSTLTPAPTTDDILLGVIMTLCSLLCIVPNVVVVRAIVRDKELYRLNAYKLMIFMAFFDVAQLSVHAITGVFNACQTTFSHTLAKMLGAIATPSYIAYAVMTVVLSFNRLTQLCFPKLDKYLFSKQTMFVWYIFGFLFFGLFSAALASPFATIRYYPEYWSWDYERSEEYPWSETVQKIEEVIEIGGIPISGLLYIYVFIVLVSKRRKFTTSKDYRAELKVLIQAVIITVYCSILNIFWHNYQVLLPATNLAWSLLNFMWIFNGAVNPIIYIIVNAAIRRNSSFKNRSSQAPITRIDRNHTMFERASKRFESPSVRTFPMTANQSKLIFVT